MTDAIGGSSPRSGTVCGRHPVGPGGRRPSCPRSPPVIPVPPDRHRAAEAPRLPLPGLRRVGGGHTGAVTDLTGGPGSNDDGRGVVPGVTTTTASRPMARAYVVWLVALVAYAVAVFHRASLGVAGVEAQERFSAGASAVSLFLVLQLAVYAALQVPVGVALDRFGSRRLILAGALMMATGQLVLALATDVPTAIAARVLVGAGDAMTFISVLRVIGLWFPGGTVPLMTQLTGILGQVGSVVAAYPLVALLHGTSWQTTFLGAAATGVVVALLVLVALRDAPAGSGPSPVTGLGELRGNLVA